MLHKFISLICLILLYAKMINSDVPCAARPILFQSVVCVCNATYCDTITRETPEKNSYVAYTSNADGLRFSKSYGKLEQYTKDCVNNCPENTLTINPSFVNQQIIGFGGAVTDAAALNYASLQNEKLKQYLIDSYASKYGLEYNMLRIPIGCTDFSTHPYAYNEQPENDINLTNFDLVDADYSFKLPMIKALMNVSTAPLYIMGSVWSPPLWMKTLPLWGAITQLKSEYYQTFALYHLKFIESYEKQGVPIWGITTTNEPSICFLLAPIPCVGWTASNMGKWIAENLGPTIRNSIYKNVKILAADEERALLPYYMNWMATVRPDSLQYIDGVAVHWYTDMFTPPQFLSLVSKAYPTKFLISSEASSSNILTRRIALGSWDRAGDYISNILQNLNYKFVGWLDWNMVLDESGGPNYALNSVDSPIVAYPEKGEFIKQPIFYVMGHFSKFLPRDTNIVNVQEDKPFFSSSIENIAGVTPNNTVVIVLHNKNSQERRVKVRLNEQQIVLNLSARSVTTIEIKQ